jgi:hypothetical protein
LDWSDYDENFVAHGRRLQEKGLRILLTSFAIDDMPHPDQTYDRIGRLCRAINEQTVTAFIVLNEPWMVNTNDPGGRENWPRWRRYLGIFQQHFPWGIQGTAAPATQEDPAGLIASAMAPSTVATLQGTRVSADDSIRRAFNVKHEGYRTFQKPIMDEEMTGPNLSGGAGAVYQPMNDPDDLFGLYTMKILTGQMAVYLNGPGLWEQGPIDATWGLKELGPLWQAIGIPDDVGNWPTTNLHNGPLRGAGMARLDGVHDEERGICFKIASGERQSAWTVTAQWSGQLRVYRSRGLLTDEPIQAGQTFTFTDGGNATPALVALFRS